MKAIELPALSKINEVPRQNRARELTIERWWKEKCESFTRQPIRGILSDNLICRIEGELDKTVVIGAHYDKVQAGFGAADNWSGIVLLDALIDHFQQRDTHLSLEFVAFAAEEPGMFGSTSYLRNNRRAIAAMINLDTIGLRPLIIGEESDIELACMANAIAKQNDIAASIEAWDKITGDHEAFQNKGIPSLVLHSVDKVTIKRIHHRRDRPGNVDKQHLENAYQLTGSLIELLGRGEALTEK